MTRGFQGLLALSCFFLTVDSQTGQISPPQNVSLRWIDDFQPRLSWAPPQHSMENCTYEVTSRTKMPYSDTWNTPEQPSWSEYVVMEGGFLHLSVKTVCNGNHSEPVVINVTDPVLVRNLQCYIHSSTHTRCSWSPVSPHLSFFYKLVNEDPKTSVGDPGSALRACPSYTHSDGVRTGCDLRANLTQDVHILFNGTWNKMPVRNTFKKELEARLHPLKWTVTKTTDKFIINWSPPDIAALSKWKFIINYTECDKQKVATTDGATSAEISIVSHCWYSMKIKAKLKKKRGETQWSNEENFYAKPNVLVYVAIIIPLVFAGLALLTFICCRKNKDTIFPPVPEPRDLLSSISDNNNKSTVCNLYIPVEEEHNCKITLVMDPQTS